jgi:hypothetical protein
VFHGLQFYALTHRHSGSSISRDCTHASTAVHGIIQDFAVNSVVRNSGYVSIFPDDVWSFGLRDDLATSLMETRVSYPDLILINFHEFLTVIKHAC